MGEAATIQRLLDADAAGNADAARALVAALGADADLMVRVDVMVRVRLSWSGPEWFRKVMPGPAGLVLAAADANGRVRENAVWRMADDPVYLPFLALRTADWVRQVRDAARGRVAVLLHDEPGRLADAARVAARIRDWGRSSFLRGQLVAAGRPRLLWERGDGPEALRRLAFELAEQHLTVAELVEVAETSANRFVRGRAAELAAREVLWNTRVQHLTRLVTSPHHEVRAVAVTGLIRAGRSGDAIACLLDRSPLVRAMARDAARRAGIDPLDHYRLGLPAVGAIDGLSEVGGAPDAPLLVPLLSHDNAVVRARALRALRRLDALPSVDVLLPMLTDPSSRVIREAAGALRLFDVADDRLWPLLEHPRSAVRRGAYRLLRERPGGRFAAERLRADPDPKLSRMVDTDLRGRYHRP